MNRLRHERYMQRLDRRFSIALAGWAVLSVANLALVVIALVR